MNCCDDGIYFFTNCLCYLLPTFYIIYIMQKRKRANIVTTYGIENSKEFRMDEDSENFEGDGDGEFAGR